MEEVLSSLVREVMASRSMDNMEVDMVAMAAAMVVKALASEVVKVVTVKVVTEIGAATLGRTTVNGK